MLVLLEIRTTGTGHEGPVGAWQGPLSRYWHPCVSLWVVFVQSGVPPGPAAISSRTAKCPIEL